MKRKSTFAVASLVLLSLSLFTAPHVFAEEVTAPNPAVEAAAAKALMNVGIKLSKSPSREQYDNSFNDIAIALARLGRTQTALKAAQWMTPGSVTQTQSEVLRLSVRRSAILGDVTRAAGLIPQIKNNNAKADALLTVARAYLRRNDYDAAQKVLFQVTPLVPYNFETLVYTAYLFSQSGNVVVSKRLFDRAEKEVERDSEVFFSRELEIKLLQASMVDEWQQFHNGNPQRQNSLDADVLEQLLKINQVDVAVNAARHTPAAEHVFSLCIIAYYIAPQYPEKATSLLDEASKLMPQALMDIKKRFKENDAEKANQSLDTFLALGYSKTGKTEEEQNWLEQLKKDTPLEKRPLVYVRYYIFPLLFRKNLDGESTFPPDQLLRINDKIQPYLSQLHNTQNDLNPLREFINAQIAAGQISQARSNIEILDKDMRNKIPTSKLDSYILEAVSLAELWKKAGAQKQCEAMLESILNVPTQYLSDTKVHRITLFINSGLVDEGLRLFYSLPMEEKKPPQAAFYGLPYALAIAHPNQFPYELLKTNYPQAEASNISYFVKGLTEKLFQVHEEQEIVLSTYP